jgi:hypothetical protein
VSQQKKPLYNICPRLTDTSTNQLRKADRNFKAMKNHEILGQLFHMAPHMMNSLDAFIFAEERFWETEGNHVIFPENTDVLENLHRAKYNLENLTGFSLPFSSFILAMPQGFKIDGYDIPSCLITWAPYRSSEHTIVFPFYKWIGTQGPSEIKHQPSAEDEMQLGIIFRDSDQAIAYHRTLCFGSALPEILKAQTIVEFQAILGNYSFATLKGVIDSDDKDLNIQFRLFKLIAALGVYNMATEGKRLLSGFPGTMEPKMIGRAANQVVKMTTLGNSVSHAPSNKTSPETHYRTWFFRTLVDPKWYVGDYKNHQIGSRISFVPDTVVGRKVSAHTQK